LKILAHLVLTIYEYKNTLNVLKSTSILKGFKRFGILLTGKCGQQRLKFLVYRTPCQNARKVALINAFWMNLVTYFRALLPLLKRKTFSGRITQISKLRHSLCCPDDQTPNTKLRWRRLKYEQKFLSPSVQQNWVWLWGKYYSSTTLFCKELSNRLARRQRGGHRTLIVITDTPVHVGTAGHKQQIIKVKSSCTVGFWRK